MKQVLTIILFLGIGIVGGYALADNAGEQTPAQDSDEDKQTASAPLALPEGVTQITECIPGMGFHYADPASMPRGPVYVTDADETIIGIEYLITEDELEENTAETPHGLTGIPQTVNPLDVTWKAVDLAYMPQGVEGYAVPHYQLHFYKRTNDERTGVCPGEETAEQSSENERN